MSSPQGKPLDSLVVVDSSEILDDNISVKDGNTTGSFKKRKLDENSSESGEDELNDISKKKRLNWSPLLHQKFVEAANRLGDKAVPKKILNEMNVEGLTRENVASHLQKYRAQQKKVPSTGEKLKEKLEEKERYQANSLNATMPANNNSYIQYPVYPQYPVTPHGYVFVPASLPPSREWKGITPFVATPQQFVVYQQQQALSKGENVQWATYAAGPQRNLPAMPYLYSHPFFTHQPSVEMYPQYSYNLFDLGKDDKEM